MRVLVTGHNGYIGSVMVPILRGAGHDIVGLDTFFFEDCVLGDAPGNVPAIRKDIRDMRIGPTTSTTTPRCTWRGSPGKRGFAASSMPRRAACTEPPVARSSTRPRPCAP